MKLRIISLKGIFFDSEVSSVNLPTEAGEVTILDHHRPIVSVLKTGAIRIKDLEGKNITIPVVSGFLRTDSNNVLTLLVDAA